MAMIICPNCGEQVSERAKKCVHCGTMLIQEENRICAECGTQLEEGVTECPNCGCPIDDVSVLDGHWGKSCKKGKGYYWNYCGISSCRWCNSIWCESIPK